MSDSKRKRTMVYSNVKQRGYQGKSTIDLSEEHIIGMSNSNLGKKNNLSSNNGKKKKSQKKQNIKGKDKQKKIKKPKKKISKKKLKIFFFFNLTLIFIIGVAVALFKLPVFEIKKIEVTINNKINLKESQIAELSNIQINQNLFSASSGDAKKSIKSNAYVETVKIRKSIPDKVYIEVVERQVQMQVKKSENEFYYIDGQGYVLDCSSKKEGKMIIQGDFGEELIVGQQLPKQGIEIYDDIKKIVLELENHELNNIVESIDFTGKSEYNINFSNGKIAHIGDTKLLNDKITFVKKILETEDGIEGEIFVNVDLSNGENPFFRERV